MDKEERNSESEEDIRIINRKKTTITDKSDDEQHEDNAASQKTASTEYSSRTNTPASSKFNGTSRSSKSPGSLESRNSRERSHSRSPTNTPGTPNSRISRKRSNSRSRSGSRSPRNTPGSKSSRRTSGSRSRSGSRSPRKSSGSRSSRNSSTSRRSRSGSSRSQSRSNSRSRKTRSSRSRSSSGSLKNRSNSRSSRSRSPSPLNVNRTLKTDSSSADEANETIKPNKKSRINKSLMSDDDDSDSKTNKSDKESDSQNSKSKKRIKKPLDSDSSDSDSKPVSETEDSKINTSKRIKKKQNVLTDKFKKRFEKQEVMKSKISALCDSESSGDDDGTPKESRHHVEIPIAFHNAKPKKDKAPPKERPQKPQRMSAQEAMKQMQKIKSESGRMLREKQVLLPYHRPKQLSLAEILNRKKINLTVGEKKPSFKMNQEQLAKFSQEIEEKVQTMIELCKSESEEDEQDADDENKTVETPIDDTKNEKLEKTVETEEIILEKVDQEEMQIENTENDEIIKTIENETDAKSEDDDIEHTEVTENSIPNDNVKNSENDCSEINKETVDEDITDIDTENTEFTEMNLSLKLPEENTENIDGENTELTANTEETIFQSEEIITNSEMFEKEETQLPSQLRTPFSQILLSSLPNLTPTPRLAGCPGAVIDLESGDMKLTGVELLKQRFLRHSQMKTPEEKEREREKKIQPGGLLSKLKHKLEEQMYEQRTQELTKKMEEEQLKKAEEKADNLSDCEEALEDETKEFNKKLDATEMPKVESESGESEPEENDVIIKDKPKDKCDFLDEEAEEDEDENEGVSEDESDSDSGDELQTTVIDAEKKKSRILKAFEDSDEETETPQLESQNLDLNTPVKSTESFSKGVGSAELFQSQDMDWEDHLTLAQKNLPDATPNPKSRPALLQNIGKESSSLADLISPLIKSTTKRITSSENFDQQESPSFIFVSPKAMPKTSAPNDKLQNLQKKLFFDSESYSQSTQDLVDMCSGNFPTQTESPKLSEDGFKAPDGLLDNLSDKYNGGEMSQNTENELLELCTGKFNIPDEKNTSTDSQNISLSLDPNSEALINNSEGIDSNLVSKSSEEIPRSEKENSTPKNTIDLFFKSTEEIEKVVEEPAATVSKHGRKFVILSSSEDNAEIANDDDGRPMKKILKSKKSRNEKRKRIALQISDDESTEESDEEDVDDGELQDEDQASDADDSGKLVDYDSEENEIEVQTHAVPIVKKKKKTSEFFEKEAELTSEDEWRGSGDEDERGLDMMEAEAGDADQLDQNAVKSELEKIHMRQILDQDKREVRILQEMLLEDGDLEGGTRERKFRWKNIDTGIENGAILDEDGEMISLEDAQSEEQWRRQRHEREMFLQQLMEKENSSTVQLEETSILSITKSVMKKTIDEVDTDEGAKKKTVKDLPSPVKKPFLLTKNNIRGSFLSRGQAALNRLALLTKNGPVGNSNDPSSKMNALGPRQKGNFVFTTISPPCKDKSESEDIKMAKRKANAEINSTPLLIKKMRVTEKIKVKNSLLDSME